MELSIYEKGDVKKSEFVRERVRERVESHLSKFGESIREIRVTLSHDKVNFVAEANIHFAGHDTHATATSDNMYKSIDKMVDKVARLARDEKSKHAIRK